MVEGSGATFFFILFTGGLLLRPRDIPRMSRLAGRGMGMTMTAIRNIRDAADQAIRETSNASGKNPDMMRVREQLKSSISAYDNLTTTMRRDMAGVSFRPSSLLRKGWDKAQQQQLQTTRHGDGVDMNGSGNDEEMDVQKSSSQIRRQMSVGMDSEKKGMKGVDFIARSFEEAAFLEQKGRIFGGSGPQDVKPENRS